MRGKGVGGLRVGEGKGREDSGEGGWRWDRAIGREGVGGGVPGGEEL